MALHCCRYLFKDSVALTIQSGDSGHMLVVLKTNLCYVFIFPDNLKSVNSVTFITNITQHWAESQDILQMFYAFCQLQASETVEY